MDPLTHTAVLEALFSNLKEAFIACDIDRRVIQMNPAAEKLFGYTFEELKGKETQILYADNQDFSRTSQKQFRASDGPNLATRTYRIQYRRKDGSVFTSQSISAPIKTETGELCGFIGIHKDVSPEVRAEDALERIYEISSNQKLLPTDKMTAILREGSAYFGLPLGIISRIIGSHYRVETVVSPDDSIQPGVEFDLGDTFCSLVISTGLPLAVSRIETSPYAAHPCLEHQDLQSYIGMPVLVKGSRFGTINFSSPEPRDTEFSETEFNFIRLFSQAVGFEIATAQQLARLEDALAEADQMRVRAETASAAKTQFLTNMSHEIRTPLNGVLGMAQLLERCDLPAKERKYVETINTSGRALRSLIDDVLDLSRIEATGLELNQSSFHLGDVCREALETTRGTAASKALELSVDIAKSCERTVWGDPQKLRQILINLLGNAVKFTTAGFVSLKVDALEGDQVRFEVEDSGPGVPDERRKAIFKRFAVETMTMNTPEGSAGVGLSIVSDLVSLMEGRIGVDDGVTGGALFWVELDFTKPEDASSDALNLTKSAQ